MCPELDPISSDPSAGLEQSPGLSATDKATQIDARRTSLVARRFKIDCRQWPRPSAVLKYILCWALSQGFHTILHRNFPLARSKQSKSPRAPDALYHDSALRRVSRLGSRYRTHTTTVMGERDVDSNGESIYNPPSIVLILLLFSLGTDLLAR